MSFFNKNLVLKSDFLLFVLILLFVIVRLSSLNVIPIFADEAIYIRWAQLIIDDWHRYLFFPLNDGKTPLFIWFLVPFQFLFENQLIAARIFSVIVGIGAMFVTYCYFRKRVKSKLTLTIAITSVSMTPFWFFHFGMALMDGMLTFLLIVSLVFWIVFLDSVKLSNQLNIKLWLEYLLKNPKKLRILVLSGFSFGLALLTKIPAVLFVPSLMIFALSKTKSIVDYLQLMMYLGFALFLSFLLFISLKINPAFGQLFSRGSDFLFPVSDVLFHGMWRHTVFSLPTYISYFLNYLTPGLMMLSIVGLFAKKHKKIIHLFFWSAVSFCLPIVILGRVVYPRYLFPAAIGFTFAAVYALDDLIERYILKSTDLKKQIIASCIVVSIIASSIVQSHYFIGSHFISDGAIPFVSADREQYQTEWSSGHGIAEFAETLKSRAKDKKIAVATEGTFGTLPDGLLVYFHRQNVEHIYIEGVGYPLKKLPENFKERASAFDEVYLLVNSHRLEIPLPEDLLKAQYCRPFNAPCLQVWDITDYLSDI